MKVYKPTVNRAYKMVPEGGFEPPTRGFSIQWLGNDSNLLSANYPQNSLNGINSLQKCCKPKSAFAHSLLKRRTDTQSRHFAPVISGDAAQTLAVLRGVIPSGTAITPQGEF